MKKGLKGARGTGRTGGRGLVPNLEPSRGGKEDVENTDSAMAVGQACGRGKTQAKESSQRGPGVGRDGWGCSLRGTGKQPQTAKPGLFLGCTAGFRGRERGGGLLSSTWPLSCSSNAFLLHDEECWALPFIQSPPPPLCTSL